MKSTYIAGQITGDPNYKKKFHYYEKEITKLGYTVINPATLPLGFTWEEYFPICFAMIDTAKSITLLPDWKDSPGAIRELEYAYHKHYKINKTINIEKGGVGLMEVCGGSLLDLEEKEQLEIDSAKLKQYKSKPDKFKEIASDMADLYAKKNHDYGDSFGDVYNDYDLVSGIVMLRHKLARIESVAKKGNAIENESLKDSLVDLAAYAIMTLIELDK